ncbi:hypothetical protein TNCT_337811 [Trichonephila clavata]|uniref:Uncharacterized protein n=1 Tax=Trichonephila clavata TaxID=2740835 RepID=A0A8X6F4V1_TRICU|nr:hypothetical protein TNCT_337811 [Trichonephila clavata]
MSQKTWCNLIGFNFLNDGCDEAFNVGAPVGIQSSPVHLDFYKSPCKEVSMGEESNCRASHIPTNPNVRKA